MNHSLGREGEAFAIEYLVQRGYTVLYKNYRILGSEIDIIAKISGIFVFVEVKTRSNSFFGTGKDSINTQKIQKILRGIEYFFCNDLGLDEVPEFQIDVISLEKSAQNFKIEHIQNIGFDDF